MIDIEQTIRGNADQHRIAEILVERRRVASVPSVSVRCECERVYDLDEFSDHIGSVVWKALDGLVQPVPAEDHMLQFDAAPASREGQNRA